MELSFFFFEKKELGYFIDLDFFYLKMNEMQVTLFVRGLAYFHYFF